MIKGSLCQQRKKSKAISKGGTLALLLSQICNFSHNNTCQKVQLWPPHCNGLEFSYDGETLVDNVPITLSSETRFLDVIIDEKLGYKPYVEFLVSKHNTRFVLMPQCEHLQH